LRLSPFLGICVLQRFFDNRRLGAIATFFKSQSAQRGSLIYAIVFPLGPADRTEQSATLGELALRKK
jgi:hypothetical protein